MQCRRRTKGQQQTRPRLRGALDSTRANLPPRRCQESTRRHRPVSHFQRSRLALLMKIHALAHWLWKRRIPLLPVLLTSFNRVVFATQLPAATQVGRGVRLNYSGLGTVIHSRAVIGNYVEIGPGVVIGGRSHIYEVPVIE